MVLARCILIYTLVNLFSEGIAQEFYPMDIALKKTQKIMGEKDIFLTGIPYNVEGGPVENTHRKISIYKITAVKSILNGKYVLFTSAKGRFEYFDYAMIVSQGGEVEQVKIIAYRSEHGSEVTSKKWLQQFVGFKGEKLEYGKDIHAISGATKSASSLTRDIPLALNIFRNSVK